MPAPSIVSNWVQATSGTSIGRPMVVTTAGDYLFAYFAATLPGAGAPSATIADTQGNTWSLIVQTAGMSVWCCQANASGSNTFTVTTHAASQELYVRVVEYANVTGVAFTANSGTGTEITSGLISTAIDFEASPSSDWTILQLQLGGTSNPPLIFAFIVSDSGDAINSITFPPPANWTVIESEAGVLLPPFFWLGSYALVTSSDIVTDICIRAGLTSSQIDVSLLTNGNIFGGNTLVTGFLVERPTPAAEVLKHLMQAYFFDACETNGTMKFVPRGMASALTVPEADLGLVKDKAKVNPETISQAQDLPLIVNVVYDDLALDYQQNSQQRARSARIIQTKQQKSISIPIVMQAQQALQIAETQLYLDWLERNGFKFNLGSPKYALLDPTDVIQFVYEGLTFRIRIVENSIGVNLAAMISGVNEDPTSFLSDLTAQSTYTQHGGPVVTNPLRIQGGTTLYLFDIPLLVDSDSNPDNTGFYFAMFSSTPDWTGGVLYESSDDASFAQEGNSSTSAICGLCTTTLAAPASPWTIDSKNTLTVQPVVGALTGVTMLEMLNGANGLIVGNELIQFQTAVDNGDGTFTLSNLLRGLKGTEWACGSHASGEFFLVLSSGVQRVQMAIAQLSLPLYYKAASVGDDPTAISAQTFTVAGADLKPYAPAGIGGTADGSGNIIITWIRRTRIGGEADWADGVTDVPLSEDSELYDVEILNGSTVVRTISDLTTATCVYTTAMQTADFGSTQSSVTVNVYQRSAQVGRGTKATGVAPTPGGWPLPWPAIYPGEQLFYVNGS